MKRFTAEATDKLQFFLDEEGQSDFVCVTDRAGARLEITYKGAHASRPADEIDVDGFVGVKSHRAKGKRLTTFEVASLRFIEPALPPQPEPGPDDEETAAADFDLAEDAGLAGEGPEDSEVSAPQTGAAQASVSDEVAFEVERPRGDADEVIDPEQLDLF